MGVVVNRVSDHLSRVLTSPRILRGLQFRPYRDQYPQFLRNAVVVHPRRAKKGKLPLLVSFVWGLRRTRTTRAKIAPGTARAYVKRWFPKGGTIVIQLGWWDAVNEDSARVTIENTDTGLTDAQFRIRIDRMLKDLVTRFGQKKVWVEYYRGARKTSSTEYEWK